MSSSSEEATTSTDMSSMDTSSQSSSENGPSGYPQANGHPGDQSGSTHTPPNLIANNPNDEAYMVGDASHVETPRKEDMAKPMLNAADVGAAGAHIIANNPNDEQFEVLDSEDVATPRADPIPSWDKKERGSTDRSMIPDDGDESDDEEEEEEEEEEDEGEEENYRPVGYSGEKMDAVEQAVTANPDLMQPSLAYDPAKYASKNAKASREMQDLFRQILDYQPFVAELPAKLRPFIPDYIPAIGDLDPFVKIPRPDGQPDGLGLYVVDEPSIPQSNPAVVLLELNATNAHGTAAQVVDSFENAANRPEVIDKWIADIKKVHYKKALPTVNYQRPMPDIESLMQVWPQEFEDMLNSDVALPPPHIDLDLDQYVRTLCALLDIPTYTSLVDSLHVLFTLYEEFRANQHFQHE